MTTFRHVIKDNKNNMNGGCLSLDFSSVYTMLASRDVYLSRLLKISVSIIYVVMK